MDSISDESITAEKFTDAGWIDHRSGIPLVATTATLQPMHAGVRRPSHLYTTNSLASRIVTRLVGLGATVPVSVRVQCLVAVSRYVTHASRPVERS